MQSIEHSGSAHKKSNATVKTKIRGVLFDLDGVLVNAPEWHREAFDKALVAHGFKPLTDEEHFQKYNGLSTKKKLEMLARDGRADLAAADAIHTMKQDLTIQLINEKCRPVPRIKETIFFLYRNGFKTGVVTNCSKRSAHLMLKLSGLIGCWHTCITNEDVHGMIKPHPYPYQKGVHETTIWENLTMAVDDSHHGVESAHAARIGKIWHLEKFEDLTLDNLIGRLEG
jgi:beta-phosphoglucomutase